MFWLIFLFLALLIISPHAATDNEFIKSWQSAPQPNDLYLIFLAVGLAAIMFLLQKIDKDDNKK